MKKLATGYKVLLIIFLMSLTLSGCGSDEGDNKEDEKVSTEAKNDDGRDEEDSKGKESKKDDDKEVDDKLIKELTIMTAQKYGISEEEYLEMLEDQGKTAYEEFTQAADIMGITVEEYYEYEKEHVGNLTDEEKETMAGMGAALDEANELLEALEEDENPELGTTAVENMMGLEANTSGEIRILEGDVDQLFSFNLEEKGDEYEDEYSIVREYIASGDLEDVIDYYRELLLNTEGYLLIKDPTGSGAMFQGMVNNTMVYVEIYDENSEIQVNVYFDLTSIQE